MLLPPPEKCSSFGCPNRPTHILEFNHLSPFPDGPQRAHDHVCEECGNSYMNTNRVKRWNPYLALNGAALVPVAPRIKVRVQFDEEPDAYPRDSDWWDEEDAAAMRAGRLELYVIETIDGAGEVLNDSWNHTAGPGFEGVYERPSKIGHEWLAYYATDQWTVTFGITPGDLVHCGGENLVAVQFDQADNEYGDSGWNTGFIVCQSTTTASRRLVWVENLTRAREISA